MKPMLGQLQNAAGLDELMNSSKPVAGNFDRAGSKAKSSANHGDDSSFSHMLLSTLNKAHAQKPAPKPAASAPKAESPSASESTHNARKAFAEKVAYNDNKSQPSSQKITNQPVRDSQTAQVSDATSRVTPNDSKAATNATNESKPLSFEATASSNSSEASKPAAGDSTPAMNQNFAANSTGAAPNVNQGMNSAAAVASNPVNLNQLTPEQLAALASAATMGQQPTQAAGEQLLANGQNAAADAKTILSPLKNLMAGKSASDALINRNPVLAFVTGHLEKLDPETLPALVSESALIKQAITVNDVAQFMQTPMSIGDLANLLELDQSLLNKASQAGLDPSRLVTPKEFLQALGLDAGRITSELTILKQKLPVEGVASYVQRAKAMAAAAPKAVVQPSVGTAVKKLGKDASSEISSGQKSADEAKDKISSDLADKVGAGTGAVLPGIDQQSPAQIKNNVAMNLASASQSAQSNFSGLSGKTTSVTDQSIKAPVAAKQSINHEMVDPAELLAAQAIYSGINVVSSASQDSTLKTDSTEKPSINIEAQKSVELMPQIDTSTVRDLGAYDLAKDPYSELGRQMDMTTATKIEFGGDGISQRSLEEHLLSKGFDQSLQMKPDVLRDAKSIELEASEEPRDLPGLNLLQDANATLSQDIQQLAQTTTEAVAPNLDFSQGESFQDGSANLRDQASDFAANLSKPMSEVTKSESAFTDKVSEAPKGASKESIAAKILGQAQMMFKNGGGSMRLDMEAPGIGKIDVAINLINNQLDVRIITASEQARDMISKEVVGLRDGLTQQGISLRGLEVGKAGETTPRNFAGQGQQFGQGADQQRASYNDMREYAQSFRNSFAGRAERTVSQAAPTLSRWSNAAIPSSGSGRLEVRV